MESWKCVKFGSGYSEHSDLKDEYPPDYRNNQRLICLSEVLARSLWNRLLPHLTEEDIRNITPYGYGTKGYHSKTREISVILTGYSRNLDSERT